MTPDLTKRIATILTALLFVFTNISPALAGDVGLTLRIPFTGGTNTKAPTYSLNLTSGPSSSWDLDRGAWQGHTEVTLFSNGNRGIINALQTANLTGTEMTFYIVGAVVAAGIGAVIIHEHNDDDDDSPTGPPSPSGPTW